VGRKRALGELRDPSKPGKGYKFCHACGLLVANRRFVCVHCGVPNPSSKIMKRARVGAEESAGTQEFESARTSGVVQVRTSLENKDPTSPGENVQVAGGKLPRSATGSKLDLHSMTSSHFNGGLADSPSDENKGDLIYLSPERQKEPTVSSFEGRVAPREGLSITVKHDETVTNFRDRGDSSGGSAAQSTGELLIAELSHSLSMRERRDALLKRINGIDEDTPSESSCDAEGSTANCEV
jgi:hypothetical protein